MRPYDKKMQNLIVDHPMLVYLHDLLSLREHKHDQFYTSDLYEALHEQKLTTYILGFKKTVLTLGGFILSAGILKQLFTHLASPFQYIGIGLLLIIYILAILFGRKEYHEITYQLQLKAASQYALKNFNYDEFVIFLDQYLSYQSTQMYLQSIRTTASYK